MTPALAILFAHARSPLPSLSNENDAVIAALRSLIPFDPLRDTEWAIHPRVTNRQGFVQFFRTDGRGKINVSLASDGISWFVKKRKIQPRMKKAGSATNLTRDICKALGDFGASKVPAFQGVRITGRYFQDKRIGVIISTKPFTPSHTFYYAIDQSGKLTALGGGY